MSLAIVFDSAGTLLRTVRSVVDIATKQLIPNTVETTMLTFEDEARILLLLKISSAQLLEADGTELLSSWLAKNNIAFGISCGRNIVDSKTAETILYTDPEAKVADLQLAVTECKAEAAKSSDVFAMNAGAIINTRTSRIEFGIAAAGYPFPGVRELIADVQNKGAAVFIASGDRTEKLELVADRIGISRDHVNGVATPARKADIVTSLKKEYNTVMMVGDGINDLAALRAADVSVLTLQQTGERPKILEETADHIIHDIRDIRNIVTTLLN
ncbi:MAG TPA: HAD-IC family P-type ATPase [Methanocorpusculum sp.]|nr:HAD-IC family P-type ATPase [Methanocorpusculum sp.]